MLEVELKQYLNDFQSDLQNAILNHELYGVEEFDDLLTNLDILIDGINSNDEVFIPIKEHIIDRLGLSEVIIKFKNQNYSNKDIADIISVQSSTIISESEVESWLHTYSSLTSLRRGESYGSLFDIQHRMQDVYIQLQEHIKKIEDEEDKIFSSARTTRHQVLLEVYKEVRMLTKDASQILAAISHQEKLENFKQAVIDNIKTVSPSTAQAIITSLKQNKSLYSSLLPPSS